MTVYNVVIVYNPGRDKALMCLRAKEPYLGLYNLPGGKVEPGESGLDAAYRELFEETGITGEDISLTFLMEFVYPLADCRVEAYTGRLKRDVALREEAHRLFWHEVTRDFFDMGVYAGEGNIGHMLEQVKLYWDILK
ncbi:MAG: NUDIX domain-containing protein [Clostridiales bacterium]|jgi:8-oxo-dGTP diphosphatase|nr:NUDIX domain-containing protein [Clostridiales bacterium]